MTASQNRDFERLLRARHSARYLRGHYQFCERIVAQQVTGPELAARLDATIERLAAEGFRARHLLLTRAGALLYTLSRRRTYGPPHHRVAPDPRYRFLLGNDVDLVVFRGVRHRSNQREFCYLPPVDFDSSDAELYGQFRDNDMTPPDAADAVRMLHA